MIIVAGALYLKPGSRDGFVAQSVLAVTAARSAEGCLDFAVSADAVDADRVNIFERWTSEAALLSFRGSGMDDGQMGAIVRADMRRYSAEDVGGP